jgi:hypothetical protein
MTTHYGPIEHKTTKHSDAFIIQYVLTVWLRIHMQLGQCVVHDCSSCDKFAFYHGYPFDVSVLMNAEQSILAPTLQMNFEHNILVRILPHSSLGSTPCIST